MLKKNRMYYGGCGNFYTGCGLQQRASETQAGSFFWCWWCYKMGERKNSLWKIALKNSEQI